jgi:hypothetical protein
MIGKKGCAGAVLGGLAMLALTAASTLAAETPARETYVVRHGDTLSAIAHRVFGDARRWREILAGNPQVTNANLIFPGDSLLIPALKPVAAGAGESGAGETAAAGAVEPAPAGAAVASTAEATGGTPAEETLVPELPVETVRSVSVVSPALYRSAGYISESLPAVAIVASEDERILLGAGDAAIINAPIPPGSRFTVVRADRRVFHPLTGECLGWLTRVLGTAEVTCRGERFSTVALEGMRDAAGVGDYLVPFDPEDTLEENQLAGKIKPGCLPDGPADAVIVALDEDRPVVGEQDFAYLDRGTAACVGPGRRFTIYREAPPDGLMVIGELQVLRAGENTATALITTSVQEIEVGNLLRVR